MSYAKKLQTRFNGLSKLSGGTLQKRRDTLNRAGVHHEKSKAFFSTSVKGTERRFSGSQIPRGL
ncbi:hypothetical protein HOU74_gp43 [Pectobacterium phage Phoria]|uniref:Uncharacterized protein n=2 Tax=Phimunavirus TaxID=2560202 RepID=A0A385IF85_9CAUD|nr:hypothetical protein HOU11_gp05 [Pectobacterium phage Gaspode]YP_009817308.1 hypothetical protein HOU74_gp43 [Pectobacterium phage Phoria]AXY81662.1 hypothetical protein [Pectobacterium phage Gaspode]AZF94949.1 hypothetical protein [Pectobacterium phage Phoria]